MSRSRAFVFTLNNYTEDDISYLGNLDCQYIVYGRETAPTTGTPHLQGYVYFTNARSFKAVAKLRKWRIDVAHGDPTQNFDYCTKEGKDICERGTRPLSDKQKGVTERQRWKRTRESAEAGRFAEIDDDIFIRHYSTLKRIRADTVSATRPSPRPQLLNYWIWGLTGTGKSRYVREFFGDENIFLVPPGNSWESYNGERVVLWDDFDIREDREAKFIKLLTDHYPFSVKGKYVSSFLVRPQVVIFTSNYHPQEVFRSHQDIDPILRRFIVVESENGWQENVFRGLNPDGQA